MVGNNFWPDGALGQKYFLHLTRFTQLWNIPFRCVCNPFHNSDASIGSMICYCHRKREMCCMDLTIIIHILCQTSSIKMIIETVILMCCWPCRSLSVHLYMTINCLYKIKFTLSGRFLNSLLEPKHQPQMRWKLMLPCARGFNPLHLCHRPSPTLHHVVGIYMLKVRRVWGYHHINFVINKHHELCCLLFFLGEHTAFGDQLWNNAHQRCLSLLPHVRCVSHELGGGRVPPTTVLLCTGVICAGNGSWEQALP